MKTSNSNWIEFIAHLSPDYLVIQESHDGNPALRAQIGDQRISIIQEPESDFSFWIERYEGVTGETGDELVLDIGFTAEQIRLGRNVLEAFVKRRKV